MPPINKVGLTITSVSCDASGGTISATARGVSTNPSTEYVTISIIGTTTQGTYYSYSGPGGNASITQTGLPDDVYEVTAMSSEKDSISTMEEVGVACGPTPNIAITPTFTLPQTLTLDIISNIRIASDVYSGTESMSSWIKTPVSDTEIHCHGTIANGVNQLTIGTTITDETGYSSHLDVYWYRHSYPKTCGAGQSGSYTGIGTAFSIVSMQDAIDKATIAAKLDADANLQCDTDIKLREVQMIDLSFTVSYSLEAQAWTCFHDYVPDAIFCTANRLMSFKDQSIYRHNVHTKKGIFYNQLAEDTPFKSQIEFIIANLLSKAYHAINWKSQHKTEGVIDEKKTFTAVMLYNHNQCSGEQPITLKRTTRNAEGVWRFNDFRDLVKDPNTIFLDKDGNVIPTNIMANKSFFKKSRFIGDYICVRMIFDNANNLSEIVLSDFSINDKVSYR